VEAADTPRPKPSLPRSISLSRASTATCAGLITKGDAATQLAALNQEEDAYTDSKIADVLLSDNVLDKTTVAPSLDVLEKQASCARRLRNWT